jgi:hypothetical protein
MRWNRVVGSLRRSWIGIGVVDLYALDNRVNVHYFTKEDDVDFVLTAIAP